MVVVHWNDWKNWEDDWEAWKLWYLIITLGFFQGCQNNANCDWKVSNIVKKHRMKWAENIWCLQDSSADKASVTIQREISMIFADISSTQNYIIMTI